MSYTLLHDPNNAVSAAFLAAFGTSGQVLSDPGQCASLLSNIQGYPTVVYTDSKGVSHALFDPADMAAVTAWQAGIDNGQATVPQVEFTRLGFLGLFTDAELAQLKLVEATDQTVAVFWEKYRAADTIRLDDPTTVAALGYLVSKAYLTDARRVAILAGQAPAC